MTMARRLAQAFGLTAFLGLFFLAVYGTLHLAADAARRWARSDPFPMLDETDYAGA